MTTLFSKASWLKARDEYLQAARDCKATLTDPESFWRYDQQDERVKKAVGIWIERARNCHDIALGRRPVIANFTSINHGEVKSGALYAA